MKVMSEVLQANIFFLITSIAVVVVTILVGVALFYFVLILRNIRDISFKIKQGSDVLSQDLAEFRSVVKQEGTKAKHIVNFFADSFKQKSGATSRKKKEKESEEKSG